MIHSKLAKEWGGGGGGGGAGETAAPPYITIIEGSRTRVV